MRLAGFQKTSFIDYPEKICAIIFTQGCNFKCGYCHNPELNNCENSAKISEEEIIEFLKKRQNKLDAVVISGGEPTLQKDLKDFIKKIKNLGFLVKLDSNGTNPEVLKELVKEKQLDYIAIDIKAPLEKYENIVNVKTDVSKISESIDFIINSGVDYEFRTTVIKTQLNLNDFEKISELIKGSKKYYLQKFVPTKILDETLLNEKTYSNEEFKNIVKILEKTIEKVEIR